MTKQILVLVFGLVGCGPGFQGGAGEPDDALAGAGGDIAGPGGESSTGGAHATGGSGSPGGASGAPAGAGGAETGGEPAGGASPAGGSAGTTEPTGGTGGSVVGTGGTGATGPSCTPEEALSLSDSFSWNGFDLQWDDVDRSYCARGAAMACDLRNIEIAYSTTAGEAAFNYNIDCTSDAAPVAGACGSEVSCTIAFDQQIGHVVADVAPEGDGYRITPKAGQSTAARIRSSCTVPLGGSSSYPFEGDITEDFQADFLGALPRYYPCR